MTDQFVLGQEVKSQGGIYMGLRLIDGVANHIFIPGGPEFDLVDVAFDDIATAIKARGEMNGFSDWRAPSKEDGMLCIINAPHLFNKDGCYWTTTPDGSYYAWTVDFEYGTVRSWRRVTEFRVRPVRSIKA